MPLDPALRERLRTVGIDPADLGDPGDAWRRLDDRFGPRITLVDRYALEAAARGIRPDELRPADRLALWQEVAAFRYPDQKVVESSAERGDPIKVVPYDPAWVARFERWRSCLVAALGPAAARVEHVGSSAVPGLAAKPIVDIQISVVDIDDEDGYVKMIESCGVGFRIREPGHRYFRPVAGRAREVHIHVCQVGSKWERDHLLFRDYLRAHAPARAAYAVLKFGLADLYRDDRLAYTDAKSGFVLDALEAAERWAARTRWSLS